MYNRFHHYLPQFEIRTVGYLTKASYNSPTYTYEWLPLLEISLYGHSNNCITIRCLRLHIQQRYWSVKYLWPGISRSTTAAWQVICIFVGSACLRLVANLQDEWLAVELTNNKCSATVLHSTGLRYSPKQYGKRWFLMVLPKGTEKNPAWTEIRIGSSPKRAGIHVNKFLQQWRP
jgi:hypothetical protein